MEKNLKIQIERNDSIPAFGAYLRPIDKTILKNKERLHYILLNVDACVSTEIDLDDNAKDVMIETLMHEFGHVLEDYFEIELGEERIENIVGEWRKSKDRIGVETIEDGG